MRGIEDNAEEGQDENAEINPEETPGCLPISEIKPDAIVIYGRLLPVKRKSFILSSLSVHQLQDWKWKTA